METREGDRMNEAIIMIGAGGHAKVCIELLQAMGETVAYCIAGGEAPPSCLGIPVLVGDDNIARLREQGYERAFIAIGANRLRAKLGAAARELGYELVNAVSPKAIVSPSARIGRGVAVMAGAIINADVEIGSLAIINTGATIDHDCVIGDAVHIAPQSALAGEVRVGAGSFLGIGSKVIPGITIGDGVTVGAGGVVIRNIASGTTAVGIPAQPISN
jgi:UDP-perosamine 4-acetyltransferase